ncbi:TIGR02449 family protein [Microbulbifer sp. SA54]|uniref:TIGR02449 family protein n=1 Tax=Microbulbifer sp. SA54 TaxID=3401577 RepID=UPI003AAC22CE
MPATLPDISRRGSRRIVNAGNMDKIQALELKLDTLINQLQQLAADNRALREQQSQWQHERQRLIQNNEAARSRVETMINRLKGLNQENQ